VLPLAPAGTIPCPQNETRVIGFDIDIETGDIDI